MQQLKKYSDLAQLSETDLVLMNKAIEIRERAYAPYSHFNVGAAVLLANGEIISGSNQENAVYPSGLCAERVAVFAAKSAFPDVPILAVAISCRNTVSATTHPQTSCGTCRQVMLEYELNQEIPIRVLFYGETGEVWEAPSTKMLLPFYFDKSALG